MSKPELDESQKVLLREQLIDSVHPGFLLRDFETLLEFIEPEGMPTTGKHHLPTISTITELNRRLSRPVILPELKRAALTTQPYLQGLYLLLLASGLTSLRGKGSKTRRVLVPDQLEQWHDLNRTEQYCTLLEAWLQVGQPEMVGERAGRGGPLLYPCLSTWKSIPPEGRQFDLDRPHEIYIWGIGQEFYQLALMDLFGLVRVQLPSRLVRPWRPAGVAHLPFGDALCTLLEAEILATDLAFEEVSPVEFGRWRPFLQPYFPEWKATLTVTAEPARKGVFVFQVGLGRARRLIALPSTATLDDLASWILDSVEFDSDHLYRFTYSDRLGRKMTVVHPYMEESPTTDDVRLGELPLDPGQSMEFLFDFGDNWLFDVRLERIEPPKSKIRAPAILESHGEAPEQYPSYE
jgi:hypothetical protein